MGVTFKPENFSVSHFFLTDRRYIFRNCGKSFSCGFSCSDARNATIKATEYVTFDFSFRILVLFPLQEILNVTVSKKYEFFSVLAAKIRENFDKLPWIESGEDLIKWRERRVMRQQLIGDITYAQNVRIFSRVLLRLFSGLEILVKHRSFFDN